MPAMSNYNVSLSTLRPLGCGYDFQYVSLKYVVVITFVSIYSDIAFIG